MSRTEWKLLSCSERINYFGRQLWRSSKLWATFFATFFWLIFTDFDRSLWSSAGVGNSAFLLHSTFLSKKKIIEGQKDIFTGIVVMTFHGTDSLSRSLHIFKRLNFFKCKVHNDAIESLSKNEKLFYLHKVKRNQYNV